MIVKDEEKNLSRCLESVKDLVDEMIIVDTGSTDGTVEIAKSFGAKVFHFAWTDSFSDARNYSLKQAKGDWIMIMDADDEMGDCGPDEIRSLMDDPDADAYFFETISYIGDEPGNDIVKSMNLRLLKNNKGYFFINPVHEQIYSVIMARNPKARIISKDIKVYHYGYLTGSIEQNKKRARNIALLEKQLKETPGYDFVLYNLGSEYCAMDNNEKALEYFEQAYQNFNPKEGFGPVMIFKMVNCYLFLGRDERALALCDSGLGFYPQFTDLVYIKGMIFREAGKTDIAVSHFKRCCEMGEAPSCLNVIVGTGTYRPLFSLGEIYFEMKDYESAAKSFEGSLRINPGFQDAAAMLDKTIDQIKQNDDRLAGNTEKAANQTSLNITDS